MRVLAFVALTFVVGCGAVVTPTRNEEFLGAAEVPNDLPAKHDFTQLHRLSEALSNFSFPDKGPRSITTWRQGGGKGISTTIDGDEEELTQALRSWGDEFKVMDISNIAVISDSGRTIRFIDYKTYEGTNVPRIKLKRGDVVALMLPQAAN